MTSVVFYYPRYDLEMSQTRLFSYSVEQALERLLSWLKDSNDMMSGPVFLVDLVLEKGVFCTRAVGRVLVLCMTIDRH